MKIEVKSIAKSYGKNHILRDISFEASSGDCIAFIGDNGCGKTTLLSILVGIEKAVTGQILIDGHKITDLKSEGDKLIGYVPQTDPLPYNMTVKQCLKLWCNNRSDYDYVVSRYQLADMLNKKVSKLSGGMRRRVSIACAVSNNPSILVMDEPTAALDIKYKYLIHQDMKQFINDGGIIILVTHEREEMDICNMCYRIKNGRNEKI